MFFKFFSILFIFFNSIFGKIILKINEKNKHDFQVQKKCINYKESEKICFHPNLDILTKETKYNDKNLTLRLDINFNNTFFKIKKFPKDLKIKENHLKINYEKETYKNAKKIESEVHIGDFTFTFPFYLIKNSQGIKLKNEGVLGFGETNKGILSNLDSEDPYFSLSFSKKNGNFLDFPTEFNGEENDDSWINSENSLNWALKSKFEGKKNENIIWKNSEMLTFFSLETNIIGLPKNNLLSLIKILKKKYKMNCEINGLKIVSCEKITKNFKDNFNLRINFEEKFIFEIKGENLFYKKNKLIFQEIENKKKFVIFPLILIQEKEIIFDVLKKRIYFNEIEEEFVPKFTVFIYFGLGTIIFMLCILLICKLTGVFNYPKSLLKNTEGDASILHSFSKNDDSIRVEIDDEMKKRMNMELVESNASLIDEKKNNEGAI